MIQVGSLQFLTEKPGKYQPHIDRAYYRQGYIFKDEDAFLHHPKRVCYVPELSNSLYTRLDFLDLCNEQKEFAAKCFYALDWQHPSSWIEEQYRDDEWGWCPLCKKIYEKPRNADGICPICGSQDKI